MMPKDLPLTDSSYESSVSPKRRSIVNKTQTEQIKTKKEKSDSPFESETIQSTDSDQKSLKKKKSKKKKQRRFDPMPEEIKIDRKVTKNLNSDLPPSPTHVKNKNS